MTTKEIIVQLEDLKKNSQSFLDETELDSVWKKDIEALDAAIAIIMAYSSRKKMVGEMGDGSKNQGQ